MTDWQSVGETLKLKMANKQPEIRIRDVAEWFGLSSTSLAEYYLDRLHEIGVVKKVKVEKYHKWFLAW